MNTHVELVPLGEFRVSRDPHVRLVTVTGPCVALALYDPEVKVAGLVHVVLPGRRRERRPGDRHTFYADTGVPLLVEEMLHHGARQDRLQATVVGGAMMSPQGNFGDVGRLNLEAVTVRLQQKGIPMVIREVLGQVGRRISLSVATGVVKVETFKTPTLPKILSGKADLPPKYLARLAREVSRLRPDPVLAALVIEELHQPHPDWWAVRRLMGRDPVLAAHFFQLANSPSYGHPQAIASMEEALNLLGGKQLRRIWLMAATGGHSGNFLKDWGLDHYQWSRHCLASAVIARYLAASQAPKVREEAFTAALLHGLGMAGLAYLAVADCGLKPLPVYPGSGQIGGLLLWSWRLPPRLVRAVAAHEAPEPSDAGEPLAVFIHAACGLSNLLGWAAPAEPGCRPLTPEAMARVGLAQGLAGILPKLLAELRAWGLLGHGTPDDWPDEGEEED